MKVKPTIVNGSIRKIDKTNVSLKLLRKEKNYSNDLVYLIKKLKTTQHLNNEMDETAEEFYQTKMDKEKDNGLSL